MDMETYRKTAEINLFGVIGGLKMFLPLIRKRQELENRRYFIKSMYNIGKTRSNKSMF